MRYFGIEEANRLVPLLARIFEVVRPQLLTAQQLNAQIEALDTERPGDAPRREALRLQRTALVQQIRSELQPLEEMGLEIKSADGLVDFHALLDGRQVFLCWRYGEETVGHWHELDAGLAGRRPIDQSLAFAPSYLS